MIPRPCAILGKSVCPPLRLLVPNFFALHPDLDQHVRLDWHYYPVYLTLFSRQNMNRYSYPSLPADRARQSRGSRPLSLVLGPFPQPHDDGASARDRWNVESDERPLTEIELEASSEGDKDDAEGEYPASWKLAIITIALCMAIFLVALVSLLPFLHQAFYTMLCISRQWT